MNLADWRRLLRPAHSVPRTIWSADAPLTFKPRGPTAAALFAGLWLFGTGEAMFIAAGLGVSPWTVLAQGISVQSGLSVGFATFVVSVSVLLLWIPLREIPGFGTLSNAVVIAVAIDTMTPLLILPEGSVIRYFQLIAGVILIGVGSGLYLTANLGPGPRDGLMTGLQRITGKPIGWVRAGLEVTVLCCGWLLGGTVGLGTVVFAIGVGYAVALSLSLVKRFGSSASF
ncbi:MAG: YczE/YyaS/YitT family protein [Arenicellales bacterium]